MDHESLGSTVILSARRQQQGDRYSWMVDQMGRLPQASRVLVVPPAPLELRRFYGRVRVATQRNKWLAWEPCGSGPPGGRSVSAGRLARCRWPSTLQENSGV